LNKPNCCLLLFWNDILKKLIIYFLVILLCFTFIACNILPIGKSNRDKHIMKINSKTYIHSSFINDLPLAIYYSQIDYSLLVVCEGGLYKLTEKQLKEIQELPEKVVEGDVSMIHPLSLYKGVIEDFRLPSGSKRAAWLDDERIFIFDMEQGKIEKTLSSPSENEGIVDIYLSPTGQKALFIVETDGNDEDFLLYDWFIYDFQNNNKTKVFQESSINPPVFIAWSAGEEDLVFSDSGAEWIFSINIHTNHTKDFKLPIPDLKVENIVTSSKYDIMVISGIGAQDKSTIYQVSKSSASIHKVDIGVSDADLFALEWSPQSQWLLFKNQLPIKNTYYLTRYDFAETLDILDLEAESLDFVDPIWLYDDSHLGWISENKLWIYSIEE
jgi:hypothetical protein